MVRILGVDPGLQHTGWGVIEHSGNHLSYIACGTLHSKPKETMAERLSALKEGMDAVILTHQPEVSAIEETFVNKNPQSSLKLGHARGALIVALSGHNLMVHEYAARLVKKTVTGVGKAEKEQVAMMVKTLLPTAQADSADASDALAVAICHANHANALQAQLSGEWV